MKKIILFLFCIVLLANLAAQALTINELVPPPTMEWVKHNYLYTSGQLSVMFTRPANDTRTYYAFVGIDLSGSNDKRWTHFGTNTTINLYYDVFSDGDCRNSISRYFKYNSPTSGLLNWTFNPPSDISKITVETVTFPYYVAVSDNKLFNKNFSLDSGVWDSPAIFSAYLSTSQNSLGQNFVTKNVLFSIGTSKQATITFGGSGLTNVGGVNTIDLGTVSTSSLSQKDFTVTISANFRYSLSVTSLNSGLLLNPNAAPVESIGYYLTIGQLSSKALTTNSIVAQNQSYTNATQYNGTVTLGVVNAVTAGDYKDTLTFTISCQ
jgi:hypothetical protein